MLYLRLKERITLSPGQDIWIKTLAEVLGEKAEEAKGVCVPLRLPPGIWKVPSSALVQALLPLDTALTLLGPDEVVVHVVQKRTQKYTLFRSAAAFALLFLGSALAITWFHADVGMQDAQKTFFYLLSGR